MSAQGRRSRRLRAFASTHWVYGFLAAIVYLPPLFVLQRTVGADNKVYLYLDPARMFSDAAYLWDPNTFAGTVPHQGVGYLFPVAPYYWLMHEVGVATWLSQRLWLSTVVFFAGAGVIYLLRALRWRGPGVLVAATAYMLTPYFLDYASKSTVIALPWSGLPWMIAFVMLSVRHKGWRYPALFALTVQCIGSVNASSLAFSLFAAMLWFPFAVWVTKEAKFREAASAMCKVGVLTFFCSLWWMSGLWAQSRYGINVLQYTETVRTVALASSAVEILRGLGYWYFYGGDKLSQLVEGSRHYTQTMWAVGLSFLIPVLAFFGSGVARFRERAYFTALILFGTIMAVGAYPWTKPPLMGGMIKWFLTSSQSGSAMRSLPRAAPLVILGLAAMLGAGITAFHEKMRIAGIPQPLKFVGGVDRRVFAASGLLILLIVVNMPALFTGWFITPEISRPTTIPSYWKQDAAALDAGSHQSRIFEMPGSNFAAYRWNGRLVNTIDPILPGLTSRPVIAREQVPYGTPPTANLLTAFDDQLQQNVLAPTAVAPVARFLAAGDLNVRDDLAWELYGTVRPTLVWNILDQAPGLGQPKIFGGRAPMQTSPLLPMLDETQLGMGPHVPNPPKLAVVPVKDAPNIIRAAPLSHTVILSGDGSGLVDASGAGLLTGHEVVLYSASFADAPNDLVAQAKKAPALVLTDSNRRRAQRWGTIQDTFGETEQAGEKPLVNDPSDQRMDIFDGVGGDGARTVAVQRGGIHAVATSYGNPVTYTPDVRPAYAIDGNPNTAWITSAFGPVRGLALRLDFDATQSTDHIKLLQPVSDRQNRWITKVKLSFDNGFQTTVPLGASSRVGSGQTVTFPTQSFHAVTITIVGDNIGKHFNYKPYSGVGFAEVAVGNSNSKLQEVMQLPSDMLDALGRSSAADPLSVVLTRDRVNKYNALRSDNEATIARTWTTPTSRSYGLTGTARLAPEAKPSVIDATLGMPNAAFGGVDVTESRHLAGTPTQRATAAIDGSDSTWWTTGFLSSVGDFARYHVASPISFDHFDLGIVADGQHSIPTKLAVTVDGKAVDVDVPPVQVAHKPGSVSTVRVNLPAQMTGNTVSFKILALEKHTTRDWYTLSPIVAPVAIAEWGVPGLAAHTPSADTPLSTACHDQLVSINGKYVSVSITGTVGQALAGDAMKLTACDLNSGGLSLPAGRENLFTANGALGGLDVDQLVLRSGAGGNAEAATGPLVRAPAAQKPTVKVVDEGRTKIGLDVTGASKPFWLVLGQSQSKGWNAIVDGHNLGGSTLVNGYANGWQVDPHGKSALHVTLVWTPQRVVWIAIGLSVLAVLACMAMVLLPMRKRKLATLVEADHRRATGAASVPLALDLSRLMTYGGAAPKLGQSLLVTVGATVAGGALAGIWAAPIFGIVTLLCLRFRRARPLCTIGAPLSLAAAAGYYLLLMLVRHPVADFDWPLYFTPVAPLGWFAVILASLDVIIDRFWLRRWWPSVESEL